ncbi:MAG: pyridoxal-phosphate dependent enzyme [Candidatus Bathyarchaeota archaeon]|nr:pyridoxal-phosphate dependent enzyme [Candidatus Bathyarchaeota archaeon]
MRDLQKELKDCALNMHLPSFYSWLLKLGVGFTPIIRISKKMNKFDKIARILAKLEFTNFGESIKAKPFATMYYRNLISGNLVGKVRTVSATSGNFGLAGSFLLLDKSDFSLCMSKKTIDENQGLTRKLLQNKTKIEIFSDRYCPTVAAKRGEAIAAARIMENIDQDIINYDQYDDIGNPLSHYLTTAPETYRQISENPTHFVTSLGTCGTMIGCGHYLKKVIPDIKLIGLIPQEAHHQLGLRSKEELGATRFIEEVENICDRFIEVKDVDAYNSMLKLGMLIFHLASLVARIIVGHYRLLESYMMSKKKDWL